MGETESPYWDEDDHDLLTFTESGTRLLKEIERTRRALAAAESDEARQPLRARLEALTEAHARSTRTGSANPGETGFLSYRPPTSGTDPR